MTVCAFGDVMKGTADSLLALSLGSPAQGEPDAMVGGHLHCSTERPSGREHRHPANSHKESVQKRILQP